MRKIIFLYGHINDKDFDLLFDDKDKMMAAILALVNQVWEEYEPQRGDFIGIQMNDSVSMNEKQKEAPRLAYYAKRGEEAPMRDWDTVDLGSVK